VALAFCRGGSLLILRMFVLMNERRKRKAINMFYFFVSENSGVSFHPFKFYFPVLFVQGYCSLPDFFYKVVVLFGAPY
jgi:hypothetical protein